MNALAVGTPAAISSGSSAIGSSCWPLITARQAEVDRRLALRPGAELAHAGQRASAAPSALMPVPGLLNARNVVVPPNAAATVSWKNRSRFAPRSAAGCGCGRRSHRAGRAARSRRSPRPAVAGAVRPDRADPPVGRPRRRRATSRWRGTTVPPRTTRSVTDSFGDLDVLGALPQHASAELGQLLVPAWSPWRSGCRPAGRPSS